MSPEQWAWGVDVSTKRVAIGAINPQGETHTVKADIDPELVGAVRLAALRRAARTAAWELGRITSSRPSAILVEDANVGVGTNKPLIQAVGVVLEALAYENTCPILEIPIGTWKKDSIGNGAAKKDRVMSHAVELGFRGDTQDEADALCIAEAALRRL